MDEVGKCKPLTEPAPLVERLELLERGKGNCAPLLLILEEDVLEAPREEDEWWEGATWWWCG